VLQTDRHNYNKHSLLVNIITDSHDRQMHMYITIGADKYTDNRTFIQSLIAGNETDVNIYADIHI